MIGEKIKELRQKQNMTQEALANLLCVSYQAVSKWECGVTSPDLSLIVPIARVFNVSTDELLGMSTYEANERRSYFDTLCKNAWRKQDDIESLEHAKEAVAEFPEDMNYRNWLCYSLYYCAWLNEETFNDTMDECIRQGLVVWDNDKTDLRYEALWSIVLAYAHSDRKAKAKEYALMFPMLENKYANRNRALLLCLEGDELLSHKQEMFSVALADFIDSLHNFSSLRNPRDPRTRQAVAVEKAVYDALFTDGNPLRYSISVKALHWKLAKIAVIDGDYDLAIQELVLSRKYAEEADRALSVAGEKSSAPLLDLIVHETVAEAFDKTQLEYWLEELHSCKVFKSLADRIDFKELTK